MKKFLLLPLLCLSTFGATPTLQNFFTNHFIVVQTNAVNEVIKLNLDPEVFYIEGTNITLLLPLLTINPTDGHYPYRINDVTFGDGAIVHVDANTAGVQEFDVGDLIVTNLMTGGVVISTTLGSLTNVPAGTGALLNDGANNFSWGPAGTTINPTDGFLPERSNATTFVDSPWFHPPSGNLLEAYYSGTNVMAIGNDGSLLPGVASATYYGSSPSLALGFLNDTDTGGSGAFDLVLTGGSGTGTRQGYVELAGSPISAQLSANTYLDNGDGISASISVGTNEITGFYSAWNSTNLITLRPFWPDQLNDAAHTLDTAIPYSQGYLLALKNNQTNQLAFGPDARITFGPGTTNVLYRSGTDLVYTNAALTNQLRVVNGNGNALSLGFKPSGNPYIYSSTGVIYTDPAVFVAGSLQPNGTTSLGLDSSSGYWSGVYLAGTMYINGFGPGTTNYSRLAFSHTGTNGAVVIDSQAAGTAGNSRPFMFADNGTNRLEINLSSGDITPIRLRSQDVGGSYKPLGLYVNDTSLALSDGSISVQTAQNMTSAGTSLAHRFGLATPSTASDGVQQWSPPLAWVGAGWSTNTAQSDAVIFYAALEPIQSFNADGMLRFYSTTVTNVGIERFAISAEGPVKISSLTKAQKTALTHVENGMIVYQTDNTPGLRAYINGSWVMISTVADP